VMCDGTQVDQRFCARLGGQRNLGLSHVATILPDAFGFAPTVSLCTKVSSDLAHKLTFDG
ncbi:hypothetical protein, partial [Mycolicibacterium sp. CBMA 361]|uniref:hypothetical protein n=1 Tax=Mycolicibacterium sp. CBMA 361 TaxID=2606610 RepID=UPI00193C90FF